MAQFFCKLLTSNLKKKKLIILYNNKDFQVPKYCCISLDTKMTLYPHSSYTALYLLHFT